MDRVICRICGLPIERYDVLCWDTDELNGNVTAVHGECGRQEGREGLKEIEQREAAGRGTEGGGKR